LTIKDKLDKALSKVYNPQANDIVKGLKHELSASENVLGRKQDFNLSRPVDS